MTLPTTPGLYRKHSAWQDDSPKWHTDGWEFFYLNTDGNWVDSGWGQPDEGDHLTPMTVEGNAPSLYLSTWPVFGEHGACHRFIVARPDGKHLTGADLQALRVAMGQEPLTSGELNVYEWEDAS